MQRLEDQVRRGSVVTFQNQEGADETGTVLQRQEMECLVRVNSEKPYIKNVDYRDIVEVLNA